MNYSTLYKSITFFVVLGGSVYKDRILVSTSSVLQEPQCEWNPILSGHIF